MNKIFINPIFEDVYKKYPITVIDVGAYGGIAKRWKRAERHLKSVGFEPDERAFKNLSGTANTVYINTAVSDMDGQFKFFLTKKQGCSSVFSPNYKFVNQFPDAERFEVTGTTMVSAKRLNTGLLGDHGISDPDFLKVDTQGGEMKVFRGASELLENSIFGVEAEVEFVPIYINQPLFSEVDTFLREKGLQLFDLKKYFWKRTSGVSCRGAKGQLVFADALYLKTYESLFKSLKDRKDEQKKAKVLKAISICLIYGLPDYAIYLCQRACEDGLFSFKERQAIEESINMKNMAVKFKGKGLLGKVFYKAYKYLRSGEYHFADEEIGNE